MQRQSLSVSLSLHYEVRMHLLKWLLFFELPPHIANMFCFLSNFFFFLFSSGVGLLLLCVDGFCFFVFFSLLIVRPFYLLLCCTVVSTESLWVDVFLDLSSIVLNLWLSCRSFK